MINNGVESQKNKKGKSEFFENYIPGSDLQGLGEKMKNWT